MARIGKSNLRARRQRIPTAQEVKVIRALLEKPEAWINGYRIHKDCDIAPSTVYGWTVRYARQGFLEEEKLPTGSIMVRFNKAGIAFGRERLKEAESEELYRRSQEMASDST